MGAGVSSAAAGGAGAGAGAGAGGPALAGPGPWLKPLMRGLSWRERAELRRVSRAWAAEAGDYYWKVCCELLAEEERLFLPRGLLKCPESSWERFFHDVLWPLRGTWAAPPPPTPPPSVEAAAMQGAETAAEVGELLEGEAVQAPAARFRIKVLVRFKPAGSKESTAARKVCLPLHQRLQMLKKANGDCSTSEAMRLLALESGYAETAGKGPWAEAKVLVKEAEKENVLPAPTVEEAHSAEEEGGGRYQASVLSFSEAEGTVLTVAPGVGLKDQQFHAVHGPGQKQGQVYETAARSLVIDVLNGLNCCMLVYGQTGSGKTFTMFGDSGESGGALGRHPGVVPRCCREIFAALAERRRDQHIGASVALSMVEIYGNEVSDLLNEGKPVAQNQAAAVKTVLEGRVECSVATLEHVKGLLERGDAAKRQAATAMNERSSRSHVVTIIQARQTCLLTGAEVKSRLFLVDLGGSEKLSQSKVDEGVLTAGTVPWKEYYESRARLQEALNINLGLFSLKKCIDALHERQEALDMGRPAPFVPYADSRLTQLLSCALGGNAKTVVCVCGSLSRDHGVETVQSLRFGERCAGLRTNASRASARLLAEIESLDRDIAETEGRIEKEERWETRKILRQDRDGVEVLHVTEPVGAERHHERLELLLARKATLQGK